MQICNVNNVSAVETEDNIFNGKSKKKKMEKLSDVP